MRKRGDGRSKRETGAWKATGTAKEATEGKRKATGLARDAT